MLFRSPVAAGPSLPSSLPVGPAYERRAGVWSPGAILPSVASWLPRQADGTLANDIRPVKIRCHVRPKISILGLMTTILVISEDAIEVVDRHSIALGQHLEDLSTRGSRFIGQNTKFKSQGVR